MNKMYPLEWLDSLVLQTLNPYKTNVIEIPDNELAFISLKILKESKKIQVRIKSEVFSIQKKRQIRLLIRKYHGNLVYLLDTIIENQKSKAFETTTLANILNEIIESIDELLSFLETRFSYYLSVDECVPITYLIVAKNELLLRIDKIKAKNINGDGQREVLNIVIEKLLHAIDTYAGNKITYRQILYKKELLKSLETLPNEVADTKPYTALDELLISINFNCQEYIDYFISNVSHKLERYEKTIDKMHGLLYYYKEFATLQCNERVSFDLTKHHFKYVLDNWFRNEIKYLERKIDLSNKSDVKKLVDKDRNSQETIDKIECILSIDQMALILRASDETRILKAKSMSQVFKTIVPHLSTPHKKDLSYDSMRSKSYNAEEKDKEIAIQTLERMIKHIREY